MRRSWGSLAEDAFTALRIFSLEKVSHGHAGLLTEPEGRPGDTKKCIFTLPQRENVKELRGESNVHFPSEEDLLLQTQVFKNGNGPLGR